ncbi:MAG: hypothetical protein EZS28_041806, partial [Streblomastix strix]
QYDHALKSYLEFDDIPYPTADVIAKQEAQINVKGPIHPIGKIIISFSKFSIDFGDLNFLIDDSESVLKFASCNVFRNGGNTALNAQSLAVVNHGSLILEDFNINGSNLIGNQPLIQSTSPKLIQLATFTVTNVALKSGNTQPLLLSVTELEQETNIIISDVHVKQSTAGDEAEAGVIFVHIKELVTCSKKDDDTQIEPILVIENSELIQNALSPISESTAILIDGFKPEQFLIRNTAINNRIFPNINKAYELKIALQKDCEAKNLIDQLKDVYFGPIFSPVSVKVPPSDKFVPLVVPLGNEYVNIRVRSNGLESCTSYVANFHNDVRTLSCATIIIKAQDSLGLLKGVTRSISLSGSFTENDLRTDGLPVSFTGSNPPTSYNILFQPTGTNPNDNSLFRVRNDGIVKLTQLYIQRSNQIGSESIPIVVIISGVGQQMNGLEKNAAGQLVIEKCIFEGGNSAFSNVWYNLGLAETCNVGYGAAIVADGQTIVQIQESNIRTFEGPAVRALNGAYITIDK